MRETYRSLDFEVGCHPASKILGLPRTLRFAALVGCHTVWPMAREMTPKSTGIKSIAEDSFGSGAISLQESQISSFEYGSRAIKVKPAAQLASRAPTARLVLPLSPGFPYSNEEIWDSWSEIAPDPNESSCDRFYAC